MGAIQQGRNSALKVEIAPADLKRVEFAIGRAKEAIEDGVKKAVVIAAELALADEQDAVPVATGFLKKSLGIKYGKAGDTAEVGPQDPKAYYAIFVEWGTSKRHPEPFATPAAERARATFRATLIEEINRAERSVTHAD